MEPPTIERTDLREKIIRSGRKLYRVASDAGISPSRLGAMLNGKAPLRAEVLARVRSVLAMEK